MAIKQKFSWPPWAAAATVSFLILAPLFTFGLLVFKGLPSFAAGHVLDVLSWVYLVTWLPALTSGLLLSLVLAGVKPWLHFFTQPYDIGRCYSLGAIAGALGEAFSTWGYRALFQRPFSGFWIAGATIAGSMAGACITLTLFGFLAGNTKKRFAKP